MIGRSQWSDAFTENVAKHVTTTPSMFSISSADRFPSFPKRLKVKAIQMDSDVGRRHCSHTVQTATRTQKTDSPQDLTTTSNKPSRTAAQTESTGLLSSRECATIGAARPRTRHLCRRETGEVQRINHRRGRCKYFRRRRAATLPLNPRRLPPLTSAIIALGMRTCKNTDDENDPEELNNCSPKRRFSLLSAHPSQDIHIHAVTRFSDERVVNQVNMMYDIATIRWLRQKIACIEGCEIAAVRESRNLGAFFQSVSSSSRSRVGVVNALVLEKSFVSYVYGDQCIASKM
jgi:hypothetical protein